MDLLSKINGNKKNIGLKPRDIFMTLPSKKSGYGYPRDVQSEVWRKWFENRNNKNVVIKMNTGSGKTVVGLVILQSCLNEKKGPAMYVVPDKFLVNQVVEEADKLGIVVTEDKDDYGYSNSKAILVTTIQALVNGHSFFGMREAGRNYPIGSIIVDDVHACMDRINSQFRIKVEADSNIYKDFIDLFESSLKDYNPKTYIDIVELKNCGERMLVPYWIWQEKINDVYRLLSEYSNDNNASIYFGLPLIRECLETCDCIITPNEIEISPKGIDIDKISSFCTASRRVFMSATLADDSVFVSDLGIDEEDINCIITPENASDIGDRLIIFPKHINSEISEEEIRKKVNQIANKYNVAILVPSFNKAKLWEDDLALLVDKDNIKRVVNRLKEGEHIGKVIFVNRYDGVDLPGDACRMLVIDGLPPLNSIKERYIQGIAPQSTILLREQMQRIEQGMGRGVRSSDDECCVILMGDELSDVLSRNRGIDYFSNATRCQYELSKELWDLLVDEEKNPTIDKIFEMADYSLDKNPEWVSICKERMSTIKYASDINIDPKTIALRRAFISSLNNQWEDAANHIKQIKDEEEDRMTKGYLCQIQAEYTNLYDSLLSQQILMSGKKMSGMVLNPIDGIRYQKQINKIPQANAICNKLKDKKININQLVIYVDSVLSDFHLGAEYKKFERSVCLVGELLGFESSQPDADGLNGPDNLWAIGDNTYYIIECKSEAKVSSISKQYCDQIAGSINWFKYNYQESNIYVPIIIHCSKEVDKSASPDDKMVVMTENELSKIRNNIHSFYVALSKRGYFDDIALISDLLKIYKLRNCDIIREYTVKYERK